MKPFPSCTAEHLWRRGRSLEGVQETNSPFCKLQHSMASWLKPVYFIDWMGRGETPKPFYSAPPSVKAVEKPPLTMSKQLCESEPLLLHPVTSAMLCYLISSAGKVFVLVAAEKATAAKLSYLVRDGFIFRGGPLRFLMELLTAHHTPCPPSVCLSREDKCRESDVDSCLQDPSHHLDWGIHWDSVNILFSKKRNVSLVTPHCPSFFASAFTAKPRTGANIIRDFWWSMCDRYPVL